jgi:hypothetical protein
VIDTRTRLYIHDQGVIWGRFGLYISRVVKMCRGREAAVSHKMVTLHKLEQGNQNVDTGSGPREVPGNLSIGGFYRG